MQAAILGLVQGRRLRKMGVQETLWHEIFARTGSTLVVYSLVLDSDRRLEPTLVHGALESLQRQFPLLRTRVERIDGADHLVAGPCPEVPLTVLPPSDDWLTEHHRQLREQTIDTAAGPLWKATLLHHPSSPGGLTAGPSHRAVLHFACCHTITDGYSNALLLGRLMENLDLLAAGRAPDVSNPAPVSPCVDELVRAEKLRPSLSLVRNGLQMLSVILRRRQPPFVDRFVAPLDPDQPAGSYWDQLLPEALSQLESERLRATCRQHGVTVNAALSAAVSLAAARLFNNSGSGSGPGSATAPGPSPPVSLPTMWLVNARRYLRQARGAQLSAVSATIADVLVDSADDKDFWRLACRIRDRLDDQFESRLPLVPLKLGVRFFTPEKVIAKMEKPMEPSSRSIIAYNINNLGSLDAMFPKTEHVRVAELHRTFRTDPGTADSFGSHCFQSVGGRLFYDLNFLRGRVREEDAERFSKEVMRILREMVKTDDGGLGEQ